MLPSDFFRRNVVLSFQEDAIGIRLRDAIGVDNMMWGSDYPHSESTFPQSRKILAEILAGVPDARKLVDLHHRFLWLSLEPLVDMLVCALLTVVERRPGRLRRVSGR